MGLYYGHAAGKTLIKLIFPKGSSADFGFVELNWNF
jgi:hypothetical protein